jgi:hypothetical protein
MKTSFVPRIAFLIVAFVLSSPAFAATNPDLSGRVVFVDGEVTANGRVAETGDLLVGPQVLKTGTASTIEIIFAGRNVFRVGPQSVVRVDFAELKKTVTLDKGEFTSVLKKLSKTTGESAFILKTPTVAAGVRGTSFHVTTDGNSTYFCTCNGSVLLDDGTPADQVQLTNAHHGARIFTKGADGKITVTSAGLVGHTDASLETLGNRIGVNIDWTQPDLKHE